MSDYNVVSGSNQIPFQNKANTNLLFKRFIDLEPMTLNFKVINSSDNTPVSNLEIIGQSNGGYSGNSFDVITNNQGTANTTFFSDFVGWTDLNGITTLMGSTEVSFKYNNEFIRFDSVKVDEERYSSYFNEDLDISLMINSRPLFIEYTKFKKNNIDILIHVSV